MTKWSRQLFKNSPVCIHHDFVLFRVILCKRKQNTNPLSYANTAMTGNTKTGFSHESWENLYTRKKVDCAQISVLCNPMGLLSRLSHRPWQDAYIFALSLLLLRDGQLLGFYVNLG